MRLKKCCNERPTHEQVQRFNVFTCHVCGKEAYHLSYSKAIKRWNNLNKKDFKRLYLYAKRLRNREMLRSNRYRQMIKRRDMEIEKLQGALDCANGAKALSTESVYYQEGYAAQYAKEAAYTAQVMERFE